ncbi:MAG: DUF934 domain-containing protein [Gammaproteobacteria bacterium]
MPRQLLRDGQVVADDWSYLADAEVNPASSLILSYAEWQSQPDVWRGHLGRLGVVLQPSHKVDLLAPHFSRFSLIGLEFAGPSEGRGYSQARILREQWNFKGELRATGYAHRDQVFFMARCGFNSFEMPHADLKSASAALSSFSRAYQPSNDGGLPLTLQRR